MKELFHKLGIAACLAVSLPAMSASEFTVQNGTWVVTAEVNGQPGRGMAMDVQDGTLVMQVYNYEASGEPTFHLASGPIANERFNGPLSRYRGGRHFGSGPLEGVVDGSPGNVEVKFTSATTGTVQFPGEPVAGISRFRFDGLANNMLAPQGGMELWAAVELDADQKPVDMWTLVLGTDAESQTTGLSAAVSSSGRAPDAGSRCAFIQTVQLFRCGFQLLDEDRNPTGMASLELRRELDGMVGTITRSTAPNAPRKLVGGRLIAMGAQQFTADVPVTTPDFLALAAGSQPEPGTWVVSPELNGRPGRGMALDVQNGTLVMQVYNYEASGAPTFHLATGPFADGQAVASLIRYSGGRFFGSGALSGRESANAGEVSLSFTTPTTGYVRFPGEPAMPIQRFQFAAAQAPQPASLLGRWAFIDSNGRRFDSYDMTAVAGSRVTGGGKQCAYENTAYGTVRCTETTYDSATHKTVYVSDYRFTPGTAGRALGVSMRIDSQGQLTGDTRIVAVMRAVDRHGVLAGLGPLIKP